MADWNKPATTDTYTNFIQYLKDRDLDNAKMLNSATVTITNPVADMVRWNATNKYWEKYSGTAWAALSTKYAIDVETVDGCTVNDSGTTTTELWTSAKIIAQLAGKANSQHGHVSTDIIDADDANTPLVIVKRDSNAECQLNGLLLGAGGTAGTPAIRFKSDTDTGIYSPLAGNLAIATNGTKAVNFDSSGNADITGNIALNESALSSTVMINGSQTNSANAGNSYGANLQTTIDNTAQLTASRSAYGTNSRVTSNFTNIYNETTAYSYNLYGAYNYALETKGASGTVNDSIIYGSYNYASADNTTDTSNKYVASVIGAYGRAYVNTSGNNVVGTMYGLYSQIDVNTGTTGSVGSAYGLFLASDTTSITNKWGIYQEQAACTNYFAGAVQIGGTATQGTPSAYKLHVDGDIYASSSVVINNGNFSILGTGTFNGALNVLSTGINFTTQNADPVTDPETLDYYKEGTFTGTLTGCTTSPTLTISYVRVGNKVTLSIPNSTATSNATTCTITSTETAIRPLATRYGIARTTDNGVTGFGNTAIAVNGTITLYKDAASGAFTASGTKGVAACSISYIL